MSKTRVFVRWLNETTLFASANKRRIAKHGSPLGDAEIANGESVWEWADEWEAIETRDFPSVAMAKGWAAKHTSLDMHGEPHVVEETADPWGWETTGHWHLIGDKWESIL